MSSSSYHNACKRAHKEYPEDFIPIHDDNPDHGYEDGCFRYLPY